LLILRNQQRKLSRASLLFEIKLNEELDADDQLRKHWEKIIAESDIKEIPVRFLKSVTVKIVPDKEVVFNLEELKKIGLTTKEIEKKLLNFVNIHDEEIDSIDFDINVDAIASDVNNKTKGLLG